MIEILFWSAAAIAAYVYAGFFAIVTAWARLFPRPARKAAIEPRVSLLVAAYNEAGVIEAKIHNALALDYPAERLEIVIASDGSTDETAEAARRLADGHRVRVLDYPHNRGKLAVLNDSIPQLRGEIVAFSDATSMLAPDALRLLVRSFADPQVGAAGALYQVRQAHQAHIGEQEDFYWKYETFLKLQEASLGSILGAHGSLYAVRKELYPYPAPGTINDDYVIPLRILHRGYRVAYEPAAVAYEEAREMEGFSRRVRIWTGNFKQLREIGALLWPLRLRELFFFLSHKAGRVLVPFCMVVMAVTNLLLLSQPFYAVLAVAQGAFYVLALLGAVWRLRPKILRLPYYFTMINAAAFFGMYHAAIARRQLNWKTK